MYCMFDSQNALHTLIPNLCLRLDGGAASSLLAGVSVDLDINWSAAVRGTPGAYSVPSLPVALLYVFWSLVKAQPASAHVAPVTAIAFTQTGHAALSWLVRTLTELLYTLALSDLSRVELVAKLLSSLLFAKVFFTDSKLH